MKELSILIVGGGIGGSTAAIAFRRRGFTVTLIEKEPAWSVYGVGIIQQGNVLRAVDALGILDRYVDAGAGFDFVEVHAPDGTRLARVPSPRLLKPYPANLGIGRRALHKVLVDAATQAGAAIRLGMTVEVVENRGAEVRVRFSDGSEEVFDLVVGADGIHSQLRQRVFPEAQRPAFTGQAVWRYNLLRPASLDALHVYNGPIGAGLVPIGPDLMYLYLTTPEPGQPRYPRQELAAAMRSKATACAPAIRALAEQITDNEGVVYRPLEGLLVEGAGIRGASCCWATRRTRPRRIWARVPGWRSRTVWCWPRNWPAMRPSRRHSRPIASGASSAARTSCGRALPSAGASLARARSSTTPGQPPRCSP